jgi:alpha-beta hydrolase superfamily lysophospholipase
MTSTTGNITATDGLGLLTRHWAGDSPKARILLVHGLGEHSGRYEHVGAYFARNGYEASAFDLRGHGASGGDRVDLESFDQFVDDLALMFSQLPKDLPTIIYGHSMGGLIATTHAISQHPQPDFYVLSAPALDADLPAALKLAAKALRRIRPGLRLPNSVTAEQLSRDPAVGEKYFADPLVESKATARFSAIGLAQQPITRAAISDISVPSLVIHGADDPLVPPHASAPLAGVEGVERKLFPGLRHETHNEPEWEDVLGFVAGWLDSQLA